MVGLLNVILVVNTLIFSVQVSSLGIVQAQDPAAWWTWPYNFWHFTGAGVCLTGFSSIYATVALAILSFMGESEKGMFNKFKDSFKYSLVVVPVATIVSYWLLGLQTISVVPSVTDNEAYYTIIKDWFVYSNIIVVPYLFYMIFKIPKIFTSDKVTELEAEFTPMHTISSVLNEIDPTFSEKYLHTFEDAEVEVGQLPQLSVAEITQYLTVPFGPALKMATHFKKRQK